MEEGRNKWAKNERAGMMRERGFFELKYCFFSSVKGEWIINSLHENVASWLSFRFDPGVWKCDLDWMSKC